MMKEIHIRHFILALEAVVFRIRENNAIKGILIQNSELKLSGYVDE